MAKKVKIKGNDGDWYKEAVFILTDECHKSDVPQDLVSYANQLVSKHMKLGTPYSIQEHIPTKPTENDWIDTFLWVTIGIFIIVCVIYFAG